MEGSKNTRKWSIPSKFCSKWFETSTIRKEIQKEYGVTPLAIKKIYSNNSKIVPQKITIFNDLKLASYKYDSKEKNN